MDQKDLGRSTASPVGMKIGQATGARGTSIKRSDSLVTPSICQTEAILKKWMHTSSGVIDRETPKKTERLV